MVVIIKYDIRGSHRNISIYDCLFKVVQYFVNDKFILDPRAKCKYYAYTHASLLCEPERAYGRYML